MNCIQLLRRTSATLFLAAALATPHSREIRIGVDQAAPYQSWREGYGPVGFTVDVLEDAARRRGLSLKWINCPEGPTKALAAGKVDMWPLLGVETARKLGIYAPQPWLQNEYAIVWRSMTPNVHGVAPDWNGKTVSVVNLPTNRFRAEHFFHIPKSIRRRTARSRSSTSAREALTERSWRFDWWNRCCSIGPPDAPALVLVSA